MNAFVKKVILYKDAGLSRFIHVTVIGREYMQKAVDTNDKESCSPPNLVMLGMTGKKLKADKVRPTPDIPDGAPIARHVKNCPYYKKPARIWLDTLSEPQYSPSKVVELHPEIFLDNPRIDFLHTCKVWQRNYRQVDYSWKPTRAELGRGKRKPWPQKGTGRARHGSTVAPNWKGGGMAHGPRGPRSLYQEILPTVKVRALTSALTIKYFQQDLIVVDDMNIPSPETDFLKKVFMARGMEEKSSLLVFSKEDNIDESVNISQAVASWPTVNLMPLIALNVWSLLHHDKLMITLTALDELETKVTWHLHKYDWIGKPHNFYRDLPFAVNDDIV